MTSAPPPPGLTRKRRLAQAALWFEQIWPAIWPAVGVLGLYAAFALVDGPAYLGPWPRIVLAAAVLFAIAFLTWYRVRRVRRPTLAMADRRLERDSNLAHRPLATLADRPADPTPEQEALWRVHVARLARTIPRLRVRQPRPGLARRDPLALRGGLVVLLAAALGIAGADAPARLGRALIPTLPETPAGPGTQIQAWVTPPAYTGLPPVLLHPEQTSPRVPTGSRLTVSVTGGSSEPSLAVDGTAEPLRALDPVSWQTERDLGAGHDGHATVEIRRGRSSLATWTVSLIPDLPPVAAFAEAPGPTPPGSTLAGRPTLQTRLPWQASDDYGVVSLQAELRLAGRPDAPPLIVAVPLAGAPKSAHGIVAPDLSPHPWAGLPVIARLIAKDAPGQIGTSPPAAFTLPARIFNNPAAAVLIEVRRQLSLTPDDRVPASAVVSAIADDPASVDNSTALLLNLRALAALLLHGRDPDTVTDAQSRMWTMALALEENAPERTAAALDRAREALNEALGATLDQRQDAPKPTPAEQAEIDKRVQELRDAIQKHMEALAEQAQRDATPMPSDPSLPKLNGKDLDKLAEQLQQSLHDGKQDAAKQQMAELDKLLDALKNARPETGEQREQRRAERRQQGRDQMDAVQDMIQREGQVLDRSTQRAGDGPARPPSPAQAARPAPANPHPDQQRTADAKAQAAMRRALGELMQRFGDLTGEIPAPLGDADQAMRQAGQALADGKDAAAGDAAKRAIEALQKGGNQMSQQLAQQFGTGQQPGDGPEGQNGSEGQSGMGEADGQGDGGRGGSTRHGTGRTAGPQPGPMPGAGQRRSADRDPLGRPLQQGTSGSSESGDVRVPDDMEQARTRAIQDELRRRGADRTRKQDELDYIDRLLTPF